MKNLTKSINVTVLPPEPVVKKTAKAAWKFAVENWRWFVSLIPASFLLWLGRVFHVGNLPVRLKDKLAGKFERPEPLEDSGSPTQSEHAEAKKKAAGS